MGVGQVRAWGSALIAGCVWIGCGGPRADAPAAGAGGPGGAGSASAAGRTSAAAGAGGGGAANGGAAASPPVERPPSAAPDARVDERDAGAAPQRPDAAVPATDGGPPPREPVPVPAPIPSGCVTDVSAGSHVFECDGISHDVSVPEACLATQCGLILDVHGGTMNGKMEDNNTNLAALGREHGYAVVQPNAFAGLFDAATDDAKVLAFAETMIDVFHLDRDRVHMTGFSQGGYMTWRFICQHTDFLASAAPAAAAGAANISVEVDCSFTGGDTPPRPLDILYMHGTRDALVNFENGAAKRDAVIAALGLSAGEPVAQEAAYQRTRYRHSEGFVFEFIQHDYASPSAVGVPPIGVAIEGHCYPGSKDQTPTEPGQLMAFGCAPPNAFNWGETVMEFFMAHPRR
jgi:polyhydroxybutyrate depolymerase